ncbi:MAG: response regulator [Candidatus Marithrix sp.]|nr:response regulator [Candidatus Marithrix sp.]
MKNHFSYLSISHKLKYIIMVVSIMAMLMVSMVYVITEIFSFQRALVERITIISDLIGDNIAPSLVFGESDSAQRLLSTLRNDPAIMRAFLYQADDSKPLAQYVSQNNEELLPPSINETWKDGQQYNFQIDSLEFIKPLHYDNDLIGYIYISTNLDNLYNSIWWYLKMSLLVVGVTIGIAFLLSMKLQKLISTPIISLVNTMLQVSKTKDYSLRVIKRDADEIGSLFDSFNEMLGQIEESSHQLASYNERLEQQVTTRTIELSTTNTELKLAIKEANEAKDIAESASKAKSEFLAKMSHEIRTPMNGIMGMTELLIGTELEEKQRKFLFTIQNSAENLLEIINEILDFSKIEAGYLKLENISFNLHKTLDEVKEFFEGRIIDKGLKFNCFLSPDLPVMVVGDPIRLRQILNNLIANAVKFTEQGKIIISTTVVEERDHQTLIRFEVRDTGIGLAQTTKGKIFDSFTQADDSTTRKYGGTGLGLTISKQLVQMMGGKISMESQLEKGSLFWFTVVFKKAEKPVFPVLKQSGSTSNLDINILIAEDNKVNQYVTVYMLEIIGAKTTVVEDGSLVVKELKKQKFDVILMDCHMPNMDGFEATLAVRKYESQHPEKIAIPIIAVTANTMAGDRENCLKVGMNDFISKPFKKQALYEILKKWLPNSIQTNKKIISKKPLKSISLTIDKDVILEPRILQELNDIGLPDEKPNMLDKLLNLYMDKMPTRIEELYQANLKQDPESLFKISHNIKSNSATIGAMQMTKIAKELEMLGRSGSTENAKYLIEQIDKNYQQLKPLLEEYLT